MCGLGMFLLELLKLQLKLVELSLGLVKCDVLHEHGLRKHVKRVWISRQALIEQRVGVWILFLKWSLIQAIDEGVKKLFFLGSHRVNLRRRSGCWNRAASEE